MYCKIFTNQQVYDGMTEMNIACDNAMVTDGWICLYEGEQFVASFDMMTINGWVLIDSTADTPQTDCEDCTHWDYIHSVCVHQNGCNFHEREKMITPQTDCPWMYDSRRDYEYDKALDELERNE